MPRGQHSHVYVCGKCDHLLSEHRGNPHSEGYACPCGCVYQRGDAEYTACSRWGSSCMGPWDEFEPASKASHDS